MSITIKGVIEWFEKRAEDAPGKGSQAAFLLAVDAIREKAERENPMPLTIEKLRQMDGEPVWIVAKHHVIYADVVKIQGKEDGDAFIGFEINHRLQENGYGKTWLAYLYKPQNPCKTCLCWEKCLGVDTGCLWINRNKRRLIDANELKAKAHHTDCIGEDLAVWASDIDEAHTVDAVPVVHGRWRRFINGDGEYKYLCGVCEKVVTYEMGGSNYCPNCGAKMDGGNEDG